RTLLSPGDLDRTFGVGGLVTTDFDGRYDAANAVALQPDGKIVAVGVSTSPVTNFDFALARYNRDASLDQTFGTDGLVSTDFDRGFDIAKAVALQADGKIVVAGSTSRPLNRSAFALARYQPDGHLDATFGVGGRVVTEVGLFSDTQGVALQPDGKI